MQCSFQTVFNESFLTEIMLMKISLTIPFIAYVKSGKRYFYYNTQKHWLHFKMIRSIIAGCCLFLSAFAQQKVLLSMKRFLKNLLQHFKQCMRIKRALSPQKISYELLLLKPKNPTLHQQPRVIFGHIFQLKMSKNRNKLSYDPRAGLDEIDLFIFKDEMMILIEQMGDLRCTMNRF